MLLSKLIAFILGPGKHNKKSWMVALPNDISEGLANSSETFSLNLIWLSCWCVFICSTWIVKMRGLRSLERS